jgi:hypothetical protein
VYHVLVHVVDRINRQFDKAQVVELSRFGAVAALPKGKFQQCNRGDCLPIRAIVAYEVTPAGG